MAMKRVLIVVARVRPVTPILRQTIAPVRTLTSVMETAILM